MESKLEIRKRLLRLRQSLPPDDAVRLSERVGERLWTLPVFQSACSVFTYVSAKDNEVDTRGVIAALLKGGRRVACPASAPGGRMVWRRITRADELMAGRFGIPEPDAYRCEHVIADEFSVVLVPGIAFAVDRHRIGYGRGYFDRFLSHYTGTSIGLAFDFQIIDAVPMEAHDEQVDFVVTESRIF